MRNQAPTWISRLTVLIIVASLSSLVAIPSYLIIVHGKVYATLLLRTLIIDDTKETVIDYFKNKKINYFTFNTVYNNANYDEYGAFMPMLSENGGEVINDSFIVSYDAKTLILFIENRVAAIYPIHNNRYYGSYLQKNKRIEQ